MKLDFYVSFYRAKNRTFKPDGKHTGSESIIIFVFLAFVY